MDIDEVVERVFPWFDDTKEEYISIIWAREKLAKALRSGDLIPKERLLTLDEIYQILINPRPSLTLMQLAFKNKKGWKEVTEIAQSIHQAQQKKAGGE